MDPWQHQHERERQARVEVGVTDVDAGVARLLVLVFVLVIVSAGVIQLVAGGDGTDPSTPAAPAPPCGVGSALRASALAYGREDGGFIARVVAGNRAVLARLTACEDHLEDQSVVGRTIRPPVQAVLTFALGLGNEQAYVGRDGWLFYRPDVDHVTGPGFLEPARLARRRLGGDEWMRPPQPDPRAALLDFRDQLAARGIDLVVVPTPVKPTVHPERLAAGSRDDAPLQNLSFARFLEDIQDAGLLVFDPAPGLVDAASASGVAQYLETDTHWRPEAMTRVADALATFIDAHVALSSDAPVMYEREEATVEHAGDIVAMLELGARDSRYGPESVTLQRVTQPGGRAWSPDPGADVLLLGDSFSNIYSLGAMGWGDSAGLAEQLAVAWQRPVDRIVRNDDGAFATRQALAADLARGTDRLARTRLVIYQFSTRELSFGDWRLIDLPAAIVTLGEDAFVSVPSGETRTITGVVGAASIVPRPGTVPYSEHIRALHLTGLSSADARSALDRTEALVYVWSMRDNALTGAASLAAGDRVTLRVRPWDDVASEYEGINRSELDDERFLLAEPLWAEGVEP